MLFRTTRVDLNGFLNNLSYLRVLHLFNTKLDVLPDAICNLKHLRYLGLEGAEISTIPHEIGNLKFLQHIDLKGCKNVTQLPNSILKLHGLRTLNIRGTGIATVQRGFGMLRNLVNMSGFPTHSERGADEWCSLEELKFLSKLNKLVVERLEKAYHSHDVDKTLLTGKPNLTILELRCTSRLGTNGKVKVNIRKEEQESIEQVFSCLCPPPCIESLTIAGYFGYRLQDWMAQIPCFENLRRIEIEDYACCNQLPHGLGQLPFLDYLWIEHTPSIECINHGFLQPPFAGDGAKRHVAPEASGTMLDKREPPISCGVAVAFPRLVKLGFSKMLKWTEWDWEEHIPAMPKLEKLFIWYSKLSRLPPGLAKHAISLKILGLRYLPNLVSVQNLPSLEITRMRNITRLERITNNPSLHRIEVINCQGLKVLEDLPALRSFSWENLQAETLPQYLLETKVINLKIKCNLILFEKISMKDATDEWKKIKHVQQVKVYGDKRPDGTYKSYISLNKGQVISMKIGESDKSTGIYLISNFPSLEWYDQKRGTTQIWVAADHRGS
ncbi:hypothetical protein PR202_gb11363 [Eleusine coracana subsp. coracana]|uniref:Disease resistance R13L4/SHOC-2-like LRR domain-containing protein n=1 Tax=Eleusine coracana subsp. coracana TaxID=191504 RepID=A0AAV5EKE1_ELECO|nr:hypothetical protein PR202_gb11363 [Eleusine coracana subsp. coracana]